jgi:uncharacterized protein YndB with AHSA1/START domain
MRSAARRPRDLLFDQQLDSPSGGDHILSDMTASLSIGEYSGATYLSVKTLRHYHQVGLLEPAHVDPSSGYRYDRPDQIGTAPIARSGDAGRAHEGRVGRDRSARLKDMEERLEPTAAAVPTTPEKGTAVIHIPSVVDVPVPAEDVFAYLSDPATNPEWSPNALEVSDIPDGPTALGMRYRVKLKFFGRVNFLIDEFEPGHRVRFNCDPPGGQLLHRFIIDQIPGGTRINHLVEFEPRGLAVLAEPIIRFFTKRMIADLNKQLVRVVAAAAQ